MHDFEDRDYTKPENRFRLLEIFINKIYLYDDYAIIIYNDIKNSSSKIDFSNKKTEPEQKFGFGSFGSPGRKSIILTILKVFYEINYKKRIKK